MLFPIQTQRHMENNMNYRFICAIHYFELEKKEISISLPSGSISNERKMLVETFDNNLSIGTLGVHSIDEITEAPSYYIVEGAFENAQTKAACDAYGTQVTFAFLRQIQTFIGSFWMLRDNCAYVRDGFLYVYDKDIADGCTFKASVSLVNSFASGEQRNVCFTEKEILDMSKDMTLFDVKGVVEQKISYRDPTQKQHYKSAGLGKKEMGEMYVALARGEMVIPMKVMAYCMALEALVANTTTELSHRVAERVAVLIGNTKEERCEIYAIVKKSYDVRSKIAHGDFIKGNEDDIRRYAEKLDFYLRQLLNFTVPYEQEKSKIDDYYLGLLMA